MIFERRRVLNRRRMMCLAMHWLVLWLLCLATRLRADSTVVFNEIMYHPSSNETQMEWVELYNQMAVDMDLSGWFLTNGMSFVFPEGTIIQGGGHLVVASSPATLTAVTGATNVVGPFSGRLSNSGATIELRNNNARLLDTITYGVETEWPVGPDGGGVSLAKFDPDTASDRAANWRVSEQMGGTPGAANFPGRNISFSNSVPITVTSAWKYNDSGSDLGSSWSAPLFDDTGWASGAGLFYTSISQPPGGDPESIPTIFNSGVDSNGAALSPGSLDPHYQLTASAQGAPPPPTVPATVIQNHPAWSANDLASSWIGPVNPGTANIAAGNYNFRTTFDLTGFVYSNAVLTLNVGVDNNLNDVLVNGVSKGISYAGFAGFSPNYVLTNSFLPGTNVIDFLTSNAGTTPNPGGFRVRLSGVAPKRLPLNALLSSSPITYYFRQRFVLKGAPAVTSLNVHPIVADGAVFYLNGTEVLRYNMPAGAITGSTPALSKITNAAFSGPFNLPGNSLLAGTNVLAVEIHQAAGGGVDVLFGADLRVTTTNFPPAPPSPIVFNEIAASTNAAFWLELMNFGTQSVSLAGATVTRFGTTINTYALGNQALAPGGFLTLNETTLGFKPKSGDRLVLYNNSNNASQVLDGAVVKKTFRGRRPDGIGPWLRPDQPTPGSSNHFTLHDEIVINEIMYSHFPIMPSPPTFTTNGIVSITNTWRYNQGGVDLGTAWRGLVYDDSGWPSGRALLYNTTAVLPAAKNTQLALTNSSGARLITWYFRAPFVFNGDTNNIQVYLHPIIDDGAVFYLNGVEVYRLNLPGGTISYTNLASVSVATAAYSGPFALPSTSLILGTNLLSVEVHQFTTNPLGADVVFGTELYAYNQTSPGTAFQDSPEAWIELYNRSTNAVDLTGWSFTKGINFAFPAGKIIAPASFLVVAKDYLGMKALYPTIDVIGNYSGSLAHGGELLVLTDAAGNPADQVEYFHGHNWPEYPNAGGSSLELRDPFADKSKAEAWAASIEGAKSFWTNVTFVMTALDDHGPTLWKEFVMELLAGGECLVDDVSVLDVTVGGASMIQNGNFENGASAWRLQGTHGRSEVISEPGNPANHVLHVVSRGPSDYMTLHNHIETTFANGAGVTNGHNYRVSFRAKWLAGPNQLNTRLYFSRCQKTVLLPVPPLSGTPGARNSTYATNIGPTYADFHHAPLTPFASDSVTVSALVNDPQGVASCTLWWRPDGGVWSNAPMANPDDGSLFAGVIPSQPAGTIVQFHVQAIDNLGAVSTFPAGGTNGRALYFVADGQPVPPRIHNVRILMTAEDANFLHAATNVMSEDLLPCTIVYDNRKFFYDTSLHLQGSERGRLADSRVGFSLRFHPDDLLRGVQGSVSLDRSGGYSGLGGPQDEIVLKQIMNHAGGVPSMYDDLVYVIAPHSVDTGTALMLMARLSGEFLGSQYTNGNNGAQFKLELIYFPTTTIDGNPQSWKLPQPDDVIGSDIQDLGNDKEAYRWYHLIQNNYQRDDYTSIINLCKAFSLTGAALDAPTRQLMDLDEWARSFAIKALSGDADTYGQGYPHNCFIYFRPSDNKAVFMPWDQDFCWARSVTASIIPGANVGNIVMRPQNLRLFYSHLAEIISTSYNTTYVGRWASHYASLVGQNYNGVVTYVGQRAAYVSSQLPGPVPFSITTSNGQDFMVATPTVTLAGTAGIDLRQIVIPELAGQPDFAWPSITNWQTTVPLLLGSNPLTFLAYDFRGNLVASNRITITSTVTNGAPDTDGDGMPDAWEIAHGFNPNSPLDASLDADGDGLTNLQEYLAGTDPRNANSFLRVDIGNPLPGSVRIVVAALAGRSYSVIYRNQSATGSWAALTNFPAAPTNRVINISDPAGDPSRFYRLVTPRLP